MRTKGSLVLLACFFALSQTVSACTVDPSLPRVRLPPLKSIADVDFSPQVTRSVNGQTIAVGDFVLTILDPEPPNVADYITAFSAAMQIYSDILDMQGFPIVMEVTIENDDGPLGRLASAGATAFDIAGGLIRAAAVLPLFTGQLANNGDATISIFVDESENWYFGTDALPPFGQIDLVTVILHEITHGLGYSGAIVGCSPETETCADGSYTAGTGSILPAHLAFDDFFLFGNDGPEFNPIEGYTYEDVTTPEGLFFDCDCDCSGSTPNDAPLFTPEDFAEGSSLYHLDFVFTGTNNALMQAAIGTGSAIHDIGPIVTFQMQALGYILEIGTIDSCGSVLPTPTPTPTSTSTRTPSRTPTSTVSMSQTPSQTPSNAPEDGSPSTADSPSSNDSPPSNISPLSYDSSSPTSDASPLLLSALAFLCLAAIAL